MKKSTDSVLVTLQNNILNIKSKICKDCGNPMYLRLNNKDQSFFWKCEKCIKYLKFLCPECNEGQMILRKNINDNSLFYGCSNYMSKNCRFVINPNDIDRINNEISKKIKNISILKKIFKDIELSMFKKSSVQLGIIFLLGLVSLMFFGNFDLTADISGKLPDISIDKIDFSAFADPISATKTKGYTEEGILNKDIKNMSLVDTDNDGLSDKLELLYGTNPNNPDTDGDGYSDGDEVKEGFNPLNNTKFTKEELKKFEKQKNKAIVSK